MSTQEEEFTVNVSNEDAATRTLEGEVECPWCEWSQEYSEEILIGQETVTTRCHECKLKIWIRGDGIEEYKEMHDIREGEKAPEDDEGNGSSIGNSSGNFYISPDDTGDTWRITEGSTSYSYEPQQVEVNFSPEDVTISADDQLSTEAIDQLREAVEERRQQEFRSRITLGSDGD